MLRNTGFKSKPAAREPRPDRSDEFDSFVVARARSVMVTRLDLVPTKPVPAVLQKTPGRVQQSIRDSARGEACQVRIVGACNHDPATSIWSHWPGLDGGRGMGIKSLDVAGAVCCSACHDVIDGRSPLPPGATRESVEIDWHRGHLRSLVLLAQKGLIR